MVAMANSGVFVGGVTLQANAFAWGPKPGAMRLMAIAAGDTRGEHPALFEGAIIIRLYHVADLAIGVIGVARQRFNDMRLR
jgi:hypothetical protein